MQCSIVIRAYNEAKHIGRLLEGIGHQTLGDIELILVDSGSTDSTVDIAQKQGARIIHIPSADFSFGRSLNLGLQAASHEHVVIASAHVHPVYPDWLECLLNPLQDEAVAVVYGKQRGAAASKFSERQVLRQWFPEEDVPRQQGPFCNNANAAIKRSLWQRQGYDETLTGLEDIAWARWAQAQGYHVAYAAQAEIVHVHDETPRRVYERYRREAMAFKQIFRESHFSAYDFGRLSVTNISSDLVHAAAEATPWRHLPSIFWFRLLQFWGTYQGYRHSSPITQQLRQTFYYPKAGGRPASDNRQVEPIRYDEKS